MSMIPDSPASDPIAEPRSNARADSGRAQASSRAAARGELAWERLRTDRAAISRPP